ncbi:type I-E CRISPR-associated protein Cse1/CasA, partial [Kitasatospora sp. Ki12]
MTTLEGRHATVGLRQLFLDAHLLHDLALPIPPAASALMRIAAAITARITGLDDTESGTDHWTHHRRTLLETPTGFEENAVHTYFDRCTWDLLHTHPLRPFLQDPSLPAQCKERAGVNALTYGRPAGNNFAWFSAHNDTDPQPLPCDQALWHLLIHHYYGPAGRCSTRTLPGRKGTADLTAGPLRSTVSYHHPPHDLYTTLLLNVPRPTSPNQAPDL